MPKLQKARVLYVIRPTEGGIGKHIITLIKGVKKNLQATVACQENSWLADELRSSGIEILSLPLGGTISPGRDSRSFKILVNFMRRQKTHLVHAHGAKAALIARPAALVAGVPSIYTVHNSVHHDQWPLWKKLLAATVEHILSWPTSYIITVSRALKQEITQREKINKNKIKVIYNGIEWKELHTKPSQHNWPIPRGHLVVGTVARLAPQKGLFLLLQAAKKLIAQHRHLHFIIAGDGPLKDSLMEQAHLLGLQDHIIFTGAVRDISSVYAAMDVFVLPSLTEGLPLSLLEAMSFGLPVVATAVGGIPEVIQHGQTGLLVAPGHQADLERWINYLLINPVVALKMGAKAQRKVMQHFEAATMIEQTLNLYYNLLREKGCLERVGDVDKVV